VLSPKSKPKPKEKSTEIEEEIKLIEMIPKPASANQRGGSFWRLLVNIHLLQYHQQRTRTTTNTNATAKIKTSINIFTR
jgi:hypothetical protein